MRAAAKLIVHVEIPVADLDRALPSPQNRIEGHGVVAEFEDGEGNRSGPFVADR